MGMNSRMKKELAEITEQLENFQSHFSESKFWTKVKTAAKKAGCKVIYYVFLLYYAIDSPETKIEDKIKIIGALGYFILPLDILPDAIIGLGFTDDATVLLWTLKKVFKNITPLIKSNAKNKVLSLFSDQSVTDLEKTLEQEIAQ